MTDAEAKVLNDLLNQPHTGKSALATEEAVREMMIRAQGEVHLGFMSWTIALEEIGAGIVRVTLKEKR